MRYLAKHLFELADAPVEKIGKFSTRIAGVTVNDPEKIINIQDAKEIEILVAGESFKAKIPAKQSKEHLEGVVAAKEAKGK